MTQEVVLAFYTIGTDAFVFTRGSTIGTFYLRVPYCLFERNKICAAVCVRRKFVVDSSYLMISGDFRFRFLDEKTKANAT